MIKRFRHWLAAQYRKSPELFWLLGICLIVRMFFWVTYRPVTYDDSERYFFIAERFVSWNLNGYEAIRPPVYPFLIILTGMGRYWFYILWLWQSILGLLTVMMIYLLTAEVTGRPRLALAIGLAQGLSLHHIFLEAAILTESVSSFGVTLAIFGWYRWDKSGRNSWLLLTGTTIGFLGLTRPILLYMLPIMALFTLFSCLKFSASWYSVAHWHRQGLLWGPALLLVLGWSSFNLNQVNYFGPTTLTGYNLTNHSGGFMELASDDDALLRDIYLQHRPEQIANRGHHAMTIYRAIPEMRFETGLNFSDLSRELTRVSLNLFLEHPDLYLKSVAKAWWAYWPKANLWVPGALRLPFLAAPLDALWQLQHLLWRTADLLLVATVIWGGWQSRQGYKAVPVWWLSISLFFALSLVQALLEFGENARYSIPLEPSGWFILAVGIVLIARRTSVQ